MKSGPGGGESKGLFAGVGFGGRCVCVLMYSFICRGGRRRILDNPFLIAAEGRGHADMEKADSGETRTEARRTSLEILKTFIEKNFRK